MSAETDIPDRFVKLDEVKRRVGLSKAMIYRLIQEGKFPALAPEFESHPLHSLQCSGPAAHAHCT